MGQAVSIMDNYAYRALVWGIYVERLGKPARGSPADPEKIETAREQARVCLSALDGLAPASKWLAGDELSLADFHAAPMFALFMKTPDGPELMESNKRLAGWCRRIEQYLDPAQILSNDR